MKTILYEHFSASDLARILDTTIAKAEKLRRSNTSTLTVSQMARILEYKPFGKKSVVRSIIRKGDPLKNEIPVLDVDALLELKVKIISIFNYNNGTTGTVFLRYKGRRRKFDLHQPMPLNPTVKDILRDIFLASKFADGRYRNKAANNLAQWYKVEVAQKYKRYLEQLFREDLHIFEKVAKEGLILFDKVLKSSTEGETKRTKEPNHDYTLASFLGSYTELFPYFWSNVDRNYYSEIDPISNLLYYKTAHGDNIAVEIENTIYLISYKGKPPHLRPHIRYKGSPIFVDDAYKVDLNFIAKKGVDVDLKYDVERHIKTPRLKIINDLPSFTIL